MRRLIYRLLVFFILSFSLSCNSQFDVQLLEEDFSNYGIGPISPPVGPHTEYHFLKEAQLSGNWKLTSFYFNPRGADTAWSVRLAYGNKMFYQSINNTQMHTHPMLSAGDLSWGDYSFSCMFSPADTGYRAGIVFRSRNDRQYYFFGMDGRYARTIRVNHETAFHKPDEKILSEVKFPWKGSDLYLLKAEVHKESIKVYISDILVAELTDTLFERGKVGLMADKQAWFGSISVMTSKSEMLRIRAELEEKMAVERKLSQENPQPVLWKKIATPEFGMARNLRFGDLNNDGKTDILIGQVVHHAWPRDSFSELSCLTALTTEGEILWQIGTPSTDHQSLTNDVAFQIHDLDNDGHAEVIYTMNEELIIAEGSTGKTKLKVKTPEKKQVQYDEGSPRKIVREWDRILGDCLFFCDLEGNGHDQDILIKDRYNSFWILDNKLRIQWSDNCRTGHYPYARDVDGDGRDELFVGYTAYKHNGERLWSLDDVLQDHCDGIGVVNFKQIEDLVPQVFIASSDQGAVVAGPDGKVLKNFFIGHVQNPSTANYRDDLQGLETVSVNFWGNQGIYHFFDSEFNIYHDFEPNSYGSMCLPVNWTGSGTEYFVMNPNVLEGGLYDGWGRKAVPFPDDGHPDMCNAVIDMTGDCRDELVVWDPDEIWIYTQSDNPKPGKIYKPVRNPMYNYSNYQMTISEPGWSDN